MSNYTARQNLNAHYAQIKGASSINDVAMGFGKGWIVFAVLSSLASAFSFYQDFYKSIGVVTALLLVVVLAVALEFFKHLSIRGMFSSMNLLSRSIVSVIAVALIMTSFYTHYKSIQTFQKNLVSNDLQKEIEYQRDLQKVQNAQVSSILASNAEFAKALNNGTSKDDKLSMDSQKSNNELIKTLTTLSAQNNMNNTNLILRESRASAKTTASAILVIFIMVEIMALFSILSKVIIVDNTDENVKNLVTVMDRLEELEGNTYSTLTGQKIEQTNEKLKVIAANQQAEHEQALKQIANMAGTPTTSATVPTTPLPSPTMTAGEKGEIWSNVETSPTLPTNITTVHRADGTPTFFRGTTEDFVEGYGQGKFKVEKFPIVPKEKQKKTRIVKELGEFKILENPCKEDVKPENASDVGSTPLKLDLLKFNFTDSQIILAAWDNGALGEGDRLVKKSLVLAELEDQNIKEDNYVTLFRRLKKQGYVTFEMGYVSNAILINGVTNV